MNRTVVINVVGLTGAMIGTATPNLKGLADRGGGVRPLRPVTPAVTCSVQSTFLTGLAPVEHGIVGNGWYDRAHNETWFWRQSNKLVGGEKVWEAGKRRDPTFTCANLFWWYNMASSVDFAVTPRPMYPADGRKIPDVYTQPGALRDDLTDHLGRFPLFEFWGPRTSIRSSRWIADAALRVWAHRAPTLMLVYLPYLDYDLQRLGPDHPDIGRCLTEVDRVAGDLVMRAQQDGARVIVLSEYAITPVSRPIHINRALRKARLLAVREELGRELLDPAVSVAFAVSDHQIAHVYVNDPAREPEVKAVLDALPGVDVVLDQTTKSGMGLDHARAGDLVALAAPNAWFTYYYWLDDARCPDFARTVDIHRKPGYDPVELFLDPAIKWPMAAVAWRVLRSKLGFRGLMDVIPLDAQLVKGSHGRVHDVPEKSPVFMSSCRDQVPEGEVDARDVKALILGHIFG